MHVNASGVNLHMEINKEDSSEHTVVCEGTQTLLGAFICILFKTFRNLVSTVTKHGSRDRIGKI